MIINSFIRESVTCIFGLSNIHTNTLFESSVLLYNLSQVKVAFNFNNVVEVEETKN